jgi:spore coat polysaccharide biosynthesis protein SpsF (cytidylyltransferase family)
MREGIMFIWTEKELIMEVIEHFEEQGFEYVENMVYCMLNPDVKAEVEKYNTIDATPALAREKYKFLSKSHKTLLMLRRSQKNKAASDTKTALELRHQRTGDVVFDWTDDVNIFKKPMYYTYKLIETLLPKAHNKVLPLD